MALSRPFAETVRERIARDPAFGLVMHDEQADEIERLRGSLAIADAALQNWWGWEYGASDGVDCTDPRLLIAWRADFVARSQAGACAAHSGEE